MEEQFKQRTIGYKTRDEFMQTSAQLEQVTEERAEPQRSAL
jgi:hypothetical protein